VVGRLELRAGVVAKLATVGRIHLVVTDQAVSHLRHIHFTDFGGFFESAMTGFTRVLGVQEASNVARWREISATVDRIRDDWRDIA
jgi:hypothetical protein